MYSEISFPSLGLTVNPPSTLQLGPITIHYYGLIIAVGLLDGVLWITPFAIICARAYYCIFEWEAYADNPISVLYIWHGGLAIYGGVIGAVIGVIVFSKIKKLSLPAILDLVALGFLIGQCIGRWGNFMNREAFGAETDSFFRMGLMDALTGQVTYYHPTFLYESVWNLVGFLGLHFLSKKRQYDGQIALGYLAWYGLGRAMIEGLRTDSLWWGPFRVSQVLAAVSCFVAVIVLVIQYFKPHPAENLFVRRVAMQQAQSDDGAEDTAE